MDERSREFFEGKINEMANQGLRIIGVARKNSEGISEGLTFIGVRIYLFVQPITQWIAFEDQLREGVSESVQTCKNAGIHVVMVTGSPTT